MLAVLESINQCLWGVPIIILLFGTHLFFTLYLQFPQRHILHAIRLSVTSEPSSTSTSNPGGFAVLATTLAATLGTGNIIGVSTAIALGGPGALFWCWITGVFGMATAYAECYLSVFFRKKKKDHTYVGGPMYVMEYGLHNRYLAIFYSICTLFAAFGVGCSTQSNAIAEVTCEIWNLSPSLIGILTAVLVGSVILGGIQSISKFCVKSVPMLGFLFIGCCLFLLYQNFDVLLPSLRLIGSSAFLPEAAAGGFIGSTLQSAARYGIARGLFTNEAGIGTTAIAAGASNVSSPQRQGLISMTAVFWDTVVMCALTGLVIISTIVKYPDSVKGCGIGKLTTVAFTFLPIGGTILLPVCLIAFALTTLIGWCYFGEKAMEFLFGEKGIPHYHFCYIIMAFLGAVLPMELVWGFTDAVNAVMVFPNVLTLFLLHRQVSLKR